MSKKSFSDRLSLFTGIGKKVFAALIVIVCFSGCGPKGPSFYQIEKTLPSLQPSYGRLYFLNTSSKEARLAIDKESISKCRSGAFFWEDIQVGTHEVTADTWGDLGAWYQKIEVMAGQDHYIRIKDRKAASVATALFGVVGLLAEAATATEGQSGPFEVEVLDEIKGKEERSKLVFLREGNNPKSNVPAPAAVVTQTTAQKANITQKTDVQAIRREESLKAQGNCSVDQILSMKTSGLQDKQIKAACK
jgi:hypothetical protein